MQFTYFHRNDYNNTIWEQPMINAILIQNNFENDFPNCASIDFKDAKINLEFISRKPSILRIKPFLYCNCKDEDLVFGEKPCQTNPNENININFEIYKEKLIHFLTNYFDKKLKDTTEIMAKVRLHLNLNQINEAKNLLRRMEVSPETEMLNFYIKYKIENSEIPKDDDLVETFSKICQKLDEHSKFAFSCGVLDLFSSKFYFSLNCMSFTFYEYKFYFNFLIFTILKKRNLAEMSLHFLLESIKVLFKFEDLLLKENLIYMGLDLIQDYSWINLFKNQLKEVEDAFFYLYVRGNSSVRFKLDYKTTDLTKSDFDACGFENLFEYDIKKNHLIDHFIEKIRIKSSENIMGLIDSEDEFYIANKIDGGYSVFVNKNITIKSLVRDDGLEIQFNKKLTKIERMYDIIMSEITRKESELMLKFKYKSNIPCRIYINPDYKLERNSDEFLVIVSTDVKRISISVEIIDGIYEEKIFYL